jgi:hypothetical protein
MILLYGGGPEEVALHRNSIRALADSIGRRLDIHDLPFVQAVDNCRLRAVSARADLGVVRTTIPSGFEWTLAPGSWLQTEDLLEPFCRQQSSTAFQYLNPADGPEIIYSTSRVW